MNNPYLFFDDIVCINLNSRPDRRESTQSIYNQLNIPGRFHTVTKHPKGGSYGCFDSHIQVIREAYNKGSQNILIFEDDVKVTPTYTTEQLKKCVKFMKHNTEWDIFYLGYIITPIHYGSLYEFMKAPFVEEHVIEFKPLAAHSYCLNRRSMKHILDNYTRYIETVPYDVFLLDINLKIYCTVPILFSQHLCNGSDNPLFSNSIEEPYRRLQCFSEKNNMFCRVTYLKYNIKKNQQKLKLQIIVSVLVVTCICVVFLYFLNDRFKKPDS